MDGKFRIKAAKDRVAHIKRLEIQVKEIHEHVDTLSQRLTYNTSSVIVIPELNNSGKSRTEWEAELMDMIDEYNKMANDIERQRIELLAELNSIGSKEAHYLIMKFVWKKTYFQISCSEHYSERQAARVVKESIDKYADKYVKTSDEKECEQVS